MLITLLFTKACNSVNLIDALLWNSNTHGAMGHRIDPLCGEPIEVFLVPASAPQLV